MEALPEYSSREGCGVEVQDSCDEGSRQFGRLVIHSFHIGIALWTLSFWVPACELYIGISFLGFRRVSGSESLRVPESQSLRVPESQSLRVAESQRGKKRKLKNVKNPIKKARFRLKVSQGRARSCENGAFGTEIVRGIRGL